MAWLLTQFLDRGEQGVAQRATSTRALIGRVFPGKHVGPGLAVVAFADRHVARTSSRLGVLVADAVASAGLATSAISVPSIATCG